jgi:RNA polymerase sigma-70 factor (ECF subfamily)
MAVWTACSTVSAHRDALVLVFNEDRCIEEAAVLLGVRDRTVKSRCRYAMRALSVLLQERGLVP